GNYETLHNQTLQHSPDIQMAAKNLIISQYTLKEVASQRYPHLYLNGGYNITSNTNGAGLILLNQNGGFSGGLSLTWNIFNGFTVNTQVKDQKLVIDQMQNQLNAEQALIDANFNVAYNDYLNGLELVKM